MTNNNIILQVDGNTNDLLKVSKENATKSTSVVYVSPQSREIDDEIITISVASTNEALTFPIFDKMIDRKIKITVETID